MKNKRYLIGMVLLFILLILTACSKPVYTEKKEITNNAVEFSFALNPSAQSYNIQLKVRYNYGFGTSVDKVTAELVSPSGVKYPAWDLLSAKGAGQMGSTEKILRLNNIKPEKGNFKLSLVKAPGKIELTSATIKVYGGD